MIAGLLGIGVALLIVGLDYRNQYHIQFLLSSLIVFGFSGVMIVLFFRSQVLVKDLRKDRFKHSIRIGILRGLVTENHTNPCQFQGGPPTQNNLSEQQWQTQLSRSDHYEVRVIYVNEIDDTFSIILNPFGETYPEEDIATRRSFHRIKNYIEKGGIFINTSGIALYYMWDSAIGRNHITGQPLETYVVHNNVLIPGEIMGQTSVSHSWMNENFEIRTTIGMERNNIPIYQSTMDLERIGNLAAIGGANVVQEYRAAFYGPRLIPLMRATISIGDFQMECYPLAVSSFGIGYLVVSGFTPNSEGWTEKIEITIDRLCDRIIQIGSIE